MSTNPNNPNGFAPQNPYAGGSNPNPGQPQNPYQGGPNPNPGQSQNSYQGGPNPNPGQPQNPYQGGPNPNPGQPQNPYQGGLNPYQGGPNPYPGQPQNPYQGGSKPYQQEQPGNVNTNGIVNGAVSGIQNAMSGIAPGAAMNQTPPPAGDGRIPDIPVYVSRGNDAKVEPYYAGTEDEVLEKLINRELGRIGYKGGDLPAIKKKKMILTIIFSVITAIWVVLTKFRAGFFFTILEVINLVFYVLFLNSYDVTSYLAREIKARPDDDIANVIAGLVAGSIHTVERFDSRGKKISPDRWERKKRIAVIFAAVFLPQLAFLTPHVLYEKSNGGTSYDVRFYTEGVFGGKTLTIPETHNGKPVAGIRGNVFEGVKLHEIHLPDTITTINGHAFQGAKNITQIQLPDQLSYLGGGAFKDCESLKEISLPDTLDEVSGETFSGCEALEYVQLPSGITEIHGNTFENCRSLKTIQIPDGVTRIGGHAFYGCSRLYEVEMSSSIREIGSSAFRQCYALKTIDLPYDCAVNERAFKESPTQINRY